MNSARCVRRTAVVWAVATPAITGVFAVTKHACGAPPCLGGAMVAGLLVGTFAAIVAALVQCRHNTPQWPALTVACLLMVGLFGGPFVLSNVPARTFETVAVALLLATAALSFADAYIVARMCACRHSRGDKARGDAREAARMWARHPRGG